MKQLYQELDAVLGTCPVIALTGIQKEKSLKAELLAKFALAEGAAASSDPKAAEDAFLKQITAHPEVDDKRIHCFVADITEGSKAAKAARIIRNYVPDAKIYTVGADITAAADSIPAICDGILQTDPESSLFAAKILLKAEQIEIKPASADILAAAIDLAKSSSFEGKNILVFC